MVASASNMLMEVLMETKVLSDSSFYLFFILLPTGNEPSLAAMSHDAAGSRHY